MTITANSMAPLAPPRRLPGTEPGLAVPARSRRDTGVVIATPQSQDLIPGLVVEIGELWPDDRGVFTELFRQGGAGGFNARQVSAAITYAGVIKALHYHCRQTDWWAPLRGQFQMVLVDLRLDSPAFGRVNTIFAGDWRPWRVRIPPGVGHGYKVLGEQPGWLVYATDQTYDPTDEGRIPYDDAGLNYAWETQHR